MSEREKLKEQIKHRLHAYVDRKYELQQLEYQLAQLEATITAPRGQAMDGMPKGSGGGDAMASIVAELVGLQEKYMAKMQQLLGAQVEVEMVIDSLEPVERSLMRCRYIDGLPWESVCVALNYSWRQTHRIHSQALNKLVEAEMAKEVAE
jgi:hypothetical protein